MEAAIVAQSLASGVWDVGIKVSVWDVGIKVSVWDVGIKAVVVVVCVCVCVGGGGYSPSLIGLMFSVAVKHHV